MAEKRTVRRYRKMDLKAAPELPQELLARQYDRFQIQALLDALPNNIYNAGIQKQQITDKLERLKQALSVEKAKYQLEASAGASEETQRLGAVDDRKAWVTSRPSVMKLENDIIKAKGDLAVASLQVERLQNFFTSIRKHANLIISQDELDRATDRWKQPERPNYEAG